MGAPKAGDRDHACRMAQSGFELFDHKTPSNQLGMQCKLDVLEVATARRRETEGSRRLLREWV